MIDHDNVIGDYVHISPCLHLDGAKKVGRGIWLGIGSVERNNICTVCSCKVDARTERNVRLWSKMNIWFFNHYAHEPSLGGCMRYHNWGKELVDQGHSVTIFGASSFHGGYHENLIVDKKLFIESINDRIKYIYLRVPDYDGNGIERAKNMYMYAANVLLFARNYKGDKPDLIIARSPNPLACRTAIKLSRRWKIPCVSDIVDLWPESAIEHMGINHSNLIMKAAYTYEKWMYKKSNALIFSMEGGYDYIVDRGWENTIPNEKAFYINMGLDLPTFDNNVKTYTIDAENMENNDIFKVVYCGSVRQVNNVKQICDTAKEVLNRGYTKIRFFIHGNGDQVEQLVNYCRTNSIYNVAFYGRIEKNKIPYLLSHAELNLLNYHKVDLFKYGGSMNKMFEYFASQKPILSNCRFGYDLVEKYKCGTILESDDPTQYADAIIAFYNMDPKDREEIGRRGRKAAEDFSQPVLVNRLHKVLQYLKVE